MSRRILKFVEFRPDGQGRSCFVARVGDPYVVTKFREKTIRWLTPAYTTGSGCVGRWPKGK